MNPDMYTYTMYMYKYMYMYINNLTLTESCAVCNYCLWCDRDYSFLIVFYQEKYGYAVWISSST